LDVDRKDTDRVRSTGDPVVVIGAAGQLGEVSTTLFARSWPTIAWTRGDLDVTDGPSVMRAITDARPLAIVNCTGYNLVDEAEDDPIAALEANAFAVRSIARAAARVGAVFVQYSSDFVFDGESDRPYREDDRPNPRSVYAASKLLGEWFAADVPAHYVLRVESLFGGLTRRKSSLDKIVDAIAQGTRVRAFTDRIVSPSYVWDIAAATASLLRSRPAPGIYHCVNSGAASWFDLATEVRRQLGSDAAIEPVTTRDIRLRAARPRNCALSNDKLRAAGMTMPTWQNALGRELDARRSRPSSGAADVNHSIAGTIVEKAK
jgi:dTDP-4-dehydrorhamnose reductase